MISCGEASGDLYAGALAAELRRRAPDVEIFGFGGPGLRRGGGELLGDFTQFSVTGLVESLRVIPRSVLMLRRLIEAARERRPDVFVPIDFPDFNFRLMAGIRRLGIPIAYYVSPQLWAWRPGRITTLKGFADKVLPIFPFEVEVYRRAGGPVEFVGHPLIDLIDVRALVRTAVPDAGGDVVHDGTVGPGGPAGQRSRRSRAGWIACAAHLAPKAWRRPSPHAVASCGRMRARGRRRVAPPARPRSCPSGAARSWSLPGRLCCPASWLL